MARSKSRTNADRAKTISDLLAAEESPLREQLGTIVVDTLLGTTLAELVDVDEAVNLLVLATTGPNVQRLVTRHVVPGRGRLVAHWRKTRERPADLLGPDLRKRVERIVASAPTPRAAWAQGAVDPSLIRQLFAPIVQDTLMSFARKLPLPGVGSESSGSSGGGGMLGGIAGRLKAEVKTRAEGIAEKGKSLLGGLGAQVEAQIQGVAREFSQGATNEMKAALEARLRSPEGVELASKIRTQALKRVLDTPMIELWKDMEHQPLDEWDAMTAPIAEYNRNREPVQEFVEGELRALLALEGARTVREFLDEAGLLDEVTRILLERVGAQSRAVAQHADFAAWVGALLDASET
jgi:hypothetical protein